MFTVQNMRLNYAKCITFDLTNAKEVNNKEITWLSNFLELYLAGNFKAYISTSTFKHNYYKSELLAKIAKCFFL